MGGARSIPGLRWLIAGNGGWSSERMKLYRQRGDSSALNTAGETCGETARPQAPAAESVRATPAAKDRGRRLSLYASLLGPPAALAIIAALAAGILETAWVHVLLAYTAAAAGVSVLCLVVLIYGQIIQLAKVRHPHLGQALVARWARRATLERLMLSSFAAPAFLTAFVVIKALSTRTVRYGWDGYLASLDRAIFGVDPWQLLHRALAGEWFAYLFEYTYVGWQVLLPAAMAFVALKGERATIVRFYGTMYWTWIVAGIGLALALHSGGPVYAYVFEPRETSLSVNLHFSLLHALPQDSRILHVQDRLLKTLFDKPVTLGGGISAMPSMHVAVAAVYLCALWRRPVWRWVAGAFFLAIWVGSVYTGYHYATDGLVGAGVAALGWWLTGTAPFRRKTLNAPTRPANS